jgi:NAD-dependent dihydropyrimidine dehydrogenase PreA subunit
MSNLLKYKTETEIEYKFKDDLRPVSICYEKNKPNRLELSNGTVIESPCLNCSDTPCMHFDDSKQLKKVFDVALSLEVCPTNSISLDEKKQVVIDDKTCINCGLCAFRCKTGAIYASDDKMRVSRDITMLTAGKQQYRDIKIIKNNNLFDGIEQKLGLLIEVIKNHKTSSVVRNNLFKSYFMSLGFKVAKPRTGDVNLRMDFVLESGDTLFLVESAQIGSPDTIRDVLDGVAILSHKYEISLGELAGACCLLEFPNKRSDFYELVSDVKNVLNVDIYTLSLGVIMSILNNDSILDITAFSVNENQKSCRKVLEKALGEECDFSLNSSFLEAAK